MIEIKLIESEDFQTIINWNLGKDEEYLNQWAGNKVYSYPLTIDQFANRTVDDSTQIFKILEDNRMIGSIELSDINKETGTAKVCRFIMDEDSSGQGNGQKALMALVDYAFNELYLSYLVLRVFSYNIRAIRCYEKVGFSIEHENENYENPKWNSFTMSIHR